MINVTKEEMAAIFTEWEARVRANPDAFVDGLELKEHGHRSAEYFCELLTELRG